MFAFPALQLGRTREERAQQNLVVVIGQFDQPGLCTSPPSSIRWRVRSRRRLARSHVSARR